MPNPLASRLAVPAGRIPIATLPPASASMQRRTRPSPPHTRSRSAPASAASRAGLAAFLLFGTSYHIGLSTPASTRALCRSSGPARPRRFSVWTMTATWVMTGVLPRIASPHSSMRAKSSTAEPRSPRRKTFSAITARISASIVPSSIAVAIALSAGVGEPRTVE